MPEKLRLSPEDEFPEDLTNLPDQDLQVLDSQVQRELDRELVVEGQAHPETEFRHWDLDEEFAERENPDPQPAG